jgi:cytoskeleton protein RodZ
MSGVFQAEFGASLKAAREARNMAVADVAAKLKLTSRQIEALEEEDLGHLPSEVFVRGFVRNYARLVGLEPDSLITPVDAQAEVSETITAPSAGLDVGSSGIRRWVVYPLIGAAVFLVLVAGLYHWLRQGEDMLITTPPELATPAPVIAPPPAVVVTPAAEADAPADTASVITPLALPNNSTSPVSDTVVPPGGVTTAPTPAASASIKPAAPEAIASPAKSETNIKTGPRSMRFEPSQDAWIQVVDSKGSRFSKLVRAGSAESFSGEPPFRLVVGEAALVKLTYNGHSIDLTPFIGQKVARLTLE